MAHLRRNEHLKLFANCCNTLATAVLSIGILTPLGSRIWGTPSSPAFDEAEVFFSCFLLAIASHLLGQLFISGLKDVEDE
jgi:hypothetical protein